MKFHLRHVPLNDNGYDAYGKYWGVFLKLYHFWTEDEGAPACFDNHIRARNRAGAKDRVRAEYDKAATFFN